MIYIKLPCPVSSVILNAENYRKYIICSYEIKSRHTIVFADCIELNETASKENRTPESIIIQITDGMLPENFIITELPDGDHEWRKASE